MRVKLNKTNESTQNISPYKSNNHFSIIFNQNDKFHVNFCEVVFLYIFTLKVPTFFTDCI